MMAGGPPFPPPWAGPGGGPPPRFDPPNNIFAKTKMCVNISQGTPCRFGDRCRYDFTTSESSLILPSITDSHQVLGLPYYRFAHSEAELRPLPDLRSGDMKPFHLHPGHFPGGPPSVGGGFPAPPPPPPGHGGGPLPPQWPVHLSKTRMCKYFLKGVCPYGPRCR